MIQKKLFSTVAAAWVASSLVACSSTPEISQPEDQPKHQTASTHENPHWSYEGESGPENWGSLDQSFSACADGREQSPIDIELSKVKVDKSVENVNVKYGPTTMTVINNGHTIQVNDTSGTNSMVVDGKEYELIQMHFHKPSEHEINGQAFVMEGHLVHKNNEGELAVLAVLINEGRENIVLSEIWTKLPKNEAKREVKLNKAVNLINLLPEVKNSYRYNGSLTTPPCTEGVKWFVLKSPIEMSKEQIAAFSAIFHENNRPTQPLNSRQVIEN